MFFNAYNSSFRAGTDSSTERNFSNVGLGTVSFGQSNYVSGTFATNLAGYNNDISGAYSMGNGYNNEAKGYFSWAMGAGAAANHDGSFVFAQPGILGSGTLSISNPLETTRPRQFLIGNPESSSVSFMPIMLGINTNASNGTMVVAGVGLTWQSFQDEFNLSDSAARELFDYLVETAVLDDSDEVTGIFKYLIYSILGFVCFANQFAYNNEI